MLLATFKSGTFAKKLEENESVNGEEREREREREREEVWWFANGYMHRNRSIDGRRKVGEGRRDGRRWMKSNSHSTRHSTPSLQTRTSHFSDEGRGTRDEEHQEAYQVWQSYKSIRFAHEEGLGKALDD